MRQRGATRVLLAGALAGALALSACSRPIITIRIPSRPAPVQPALAPLSPGQRAADDRVVEVVRRVEPAVVSVTSNTLSSDEFGNASEARHLGTGFIIRSDGVIVTNFHVVENATRLTVVTVPPNPRRFDARVIGGDPDKDLAVLKVDASGLPTTRLGRSGDLDLGQRVVALGYALGLGANFRGGTPTVTSGIVSALDRTVEAADPDAPNGQGRTYSGVIQTDAAINPGNSGGPLVDLNGLVVGINTAGADQAENIGFAIAIDGARPIIDEAVSRPAAPRPYLGVSTQTVDRALSVQLGLAVEHGAYVVGVTAGSAASRAGIREGEVIVSLGGRPVTSSESLGTAIDAHRPGESVDVELVETDGARRTVTAVLRTRPLS